MTFIDQLAEIRKYRFAKVICENADFIPRIQPDIFLHPFSVVRDIIRLVKIEYGCKSTVGTKPLSEQKRLYTVPHLSRPQLKSVIVVKVSLITSP